MDSNSTIMKIEWQDDEEQAVGREEVARRIEKENKVREQEAERQEESDTGEQEGIEESQDEVRGNPPLPTAHPASVATIRELQRFDWATETDKSIGSVPNVSDFRPDKHPSPLASLEPTP
jgi:hypothetical protein